MQTSLTLICLTSRKHRLGVTVCTAHQFEIMSAGDVTVHHQDSERQGRKSETKHDVYVD